MATDTAFVIGCLALLGRRAPPSLRVFLLSLAVVDDIGAILVVAIGYNSELGWMALAIGSAGIAAVRGLALLGVRSVPVYLLAGGLIWVSLDASGIHPTVAGVALGLLTPTRGWVSDRRLRAILQRILAHPPGDHRSGDTEDRNLLRSAGRAAREAVSPVERLEMALHPWVAFGVMPIFALANAGVPLSLGGLADPVALAVVLGFVLGKPIGVVTFAWLAVRSGLAVRPVTLGWGALAGGGMLAGIGFTMALFIAELAFQGDLLQAAKLGILAASVVAAVGGLTLLAWLTPGGTESLVAVGNTDGKRGRGADWAGPDGDGQRPVTVVRGEEMALPRQSGDRTARPVPIRWRRLCSVPSVRRAVSYPDQGLGCAEERDSGIHARRDKVDGSEFLRDPIRLPIVRAVEPAASPAAGSGRT